MPTAPVDDKGTVVYYEDTGVPKDPSNYLTLVLLHGVLFHGAIFKRLLPHAEKHNLRIVRVNWRDYPHSSSYSAEELDVVFNGTQEAKAGFVRDQGHQLAHFLAHFAKTQGIPEVSEVGGKKVGGLALLAWSMGNIWSVSLLGNARSLPSETKEDLGRWLRTVVLYDPVIITCCGLDPPPEIYHPLRDTRYSEVERGKTFRSWISYYFSTVEDLSSVTTESLTARTPLHEDPTGGAGTAITKSKIPTTLRMSVEEFNDLIDADVLLRSNLNIINFPVPIFRQNFVQALVDTGGALGNVKALALWGNESVNDCVLAAKAIYDVIHEPVPVDETKVRRKMEIHEIDGGNHCPHWDIPEKVVELLVTFV